MSTIINNGLDEILDSLFQPYYDRVPNVEKITNAMITNGMIQSQNDIVNDHIAFRTLGVTHLGINSFEKIFLKYGYIKKDYYHFEAKKLDAYWYAPPSPKYPRIFMSELKVDKLSSKAQSIIAKYTQHINLDPVDQLDLNDSKEIGDFFYRPLWQLPTIQDYNDLLAESEYAAWVIYNRYYLNHYTISVHDLPSGYNTIESFNSFLESIDIVLNTSGGKIKTSNDGLLKQSSTVAEMINATFADGEAMEIAGSYVEFAERLPLISNGKNITNASGQDRRDGFESANADKIFESTYHEQTKKIIR